MTDAENFLKWIGENYHQQKKKMRSYCWDKDIVWDEDSFESTIVKCYNLIERQGKMKDNTEKGMDNYFFMAFRMNIIRDKQYAYIKNRDYNITNDELFELYGFTQEDKENEDEKIYNDALKDYTLNYILMQVEENFSPKDLYLFKLRTFEGLTYKKIKEDTKISDSKQRIQNINKWLKTNISYDVIKKEFDIHNNNLNE